MNLPAMNVAFAGPLASHPLLDSIRKALTSGPQSTETVAFLGGVVAFVLLIILAARLFSRERGTVAEPQVDYLTLAVDVLGLSETDRRDLRRVARRSELPQPAAMLLSPANLAHAAAATLAAENDPELHERLDRLCVRLFDTPLPGPQKPLSQPS